MKKKNMQLTVLLIAAVAVLTICIAIGIARNIGEDDKTATGDAAGQEESTTAFEWASAEAEDNEEAASANTGDSEDSPAAGSADQQDNAEGATAAESSGDENETTADTAGIQIQTGDAVSFPCTAAPDELRLIALYNYSGYYIEDGTEDAIDNVAALEVVNLSDEPIEYAQITLRADGDELTFEISLIPAGATVLVMEANRKACSETASLVYGGSEIAYLDGLDLCEESLEITVDDTGAITIANISGADIDELRLFYKNRLDTGEYIGGIAYTVHITDLAAGVSTTVRPSHYDPTYGIILMTRIY